ncbi:hypothetical protein DQ04_01271120 [Trypanosoma grayi]|uniref:hypothetical protein n=1 Tax=Trypanosoma grayi TaxID=71804 RepID=UPI0004F3FA5A|nr:hypothetical protein DQ04_01271120 [Trypanosoma grayi]KEG13012.1 hypothetical protein DQ04_01271120 [Trypanosoma grayi]
MREYEIEVFKGLRQTDGGRVSTRPGCITMHTSYWNYEVCPGRWIRQYRKDQDAIAEEHILGVQHRWNLMDEVGSRVLQYHDGPQTLPERLKAAGTTNDPATTEYTCTSSGASQNRRQVDEVYLEGSPCGPGFRRTVILHLVCEEEAHVPIIELAEPFLCNYDITMMSRAICDAMYGRVPAYTELSDADMKFAL